MEEEKASQSPRPQRSKLHLWGCSGVSFKAWQAEPYSRYKHIYILKPFHLFLLWLYNIPWWPDMAAECYTESWRDIKMKKNKKKRKKKRRSDEIVRGGGVERGRVWWWGILFCCSLWDFLLLSLVPSENVAHAGQTHSFSISLLQWSALRRFKKEEEEK